MATFRLRDAKPDDAPAIAEIYGHYVRTTCFTFEEIPPSADEIAARMRKVQQAGMPYRVADGGDGNVIGYVYASSFRSRSAYRYSLENSVYVDAERTRQGVGTALMKDLIQASSLLGYRQMVAIIGDKANVASIRLHRRLGFRQTGTLSAVGLKFGRWVDVTEMQLALGDGTNSIPTADPNGVSAI